MNIHPVINGLCVTVTLLP